MVKLIKKIITLGFIDQWLEELFKRLLHRKREHFINKKLAQFAKKHPDISTDELKKRLETEADRLYPIVDRSILRERIIRAKYIFWLTIIAVSLLVGSLGYFSSRNPLTFISPFEAAVVTWLGAIITLYDGYNQRIKGGMDSITQNYEKELLEDIEIAENELDGNDLESVEEQNRDDEVTNQHAPLESSTYINKVLSDNGNIKIESVTLESDRESEREDETKEEITIITEISSVVSGNEPVVVNQDNHPQLKI